MNPRDSRIQLEIESLGSRSKLADSLILPKVLVLPEVAPMVLRIPDPPGSAPSWIGADPEYVTVTLAFANKQSLSRIPVPPTGNTWHRQQKP